MHCLKTYEKKENQKFVKSKPCDKLATNKPQCQELVYLRVQFECIRGKERKKEETDQRTTYTYKLNCLAFISLKLHRVSQRKQVLIIVDLCLIHNVHQGAEAYFHHLPINRRFHL